MTISYIAGTTTTATTSAGSLTPAVPVGVAEDSLSLLGVQIKHSTINVAPTVSTPAGWTLIGISYNDLRASGTDTGSNTVAVFYRLGTYTAPTVTNTGANSAAAGIVAYSKTLEQWDLEALATGTQGSDTTAGSGHNATATDTLLVTQGDAVVTITGLSGDIGAVGTIAILSIPSVTMSNAALRVNIGVTTGADSRLSVYDSQCNAGGPATGPPSLAVTNSSSTTGHTRFVHLREFNPALPPSTIRRSSSSMNHAIHRSTRW